MKEKLVCPLLLLAAAAASQAQLATTPPDKPRLNVAIIVDQVRYDYTTRFAARYTRGLHSMLTEGAVFLAAQ